MAIHRLGRIPALAAALLVAACSSGPANVGPDARRELALGREASLEWISRSRSRTSIDARTAIATGYLERLRLGLGSPFRLIDFALNDPRLPDTLRARLAWALLDRTLAREAYQIDPVALDRIGLQRGGPVPGSGQQHLDLIEGVIRQSTDPRSGELAVRLAYTLASAAGHLGRNAPEVATRAAALLRDRELARLDAMRLLEAAQDSMVDPLALLKQWRADRLFQVEAPHTLPLSPDAELSALQIAPRLARVIAQLARGETSRLNTVASAGSRNASLLGPVAAARLRAVADSFNAPPETPIAISVILHREELIESPWVPEPERAIRRQFVERAINSETFTAEFTRLHKRSAYDSGPAVTALNAAVAMRSFAQEPVWFPGFGGPSSRELQKRWGLAAIAFDPDVPAEWRPYLRRVLDHAFVDLSRVLPALNLHGLRVLFTRDVRRDHTLAMHDPRSRRLVLPPITAAGTLAHEIAHDLDWQVALHRYRVRGDYASDRAVRYAGDRFAVKVQNLANASLLARPEPDRAAAHASRPAEVFARNVDWFVAASLAARGKMNGYLSSVQDDMLTGYGSVRPPDITGAAGAALVAILDEVAPLYPDTREWFMQHYGRNRALTPWDLIRRVLETPASTTTTSRASDFSGFQRSLDAFDAIAQARDAGFAAIDAWICRAPGASFYRQYEVARRQLVLEAARARARGLAIQLARQVGGLAAENWVALQLDEQRGTFGERPDSSMIEVLSQIVEKAREAGTAELPATEMRIALVGPPAYCAAGPLSLFASTSPLSLTATD